MPAPGWFTGVLAPAHRARLLVVALAGLGLLGFLGALFGDALLPDDPLGLVAGSLGWHHQAPPPPDVPLETFLPSQTRNLNPAQAVAENLASPLIRQNPAPPPFPASRLAPEEMGRASECMAAAIYYEAGQEPEAGQMAVAQVILNRLRHPRFPKSVCDVVYQGAERASGCQFTFSCDGSLRRRPDAAGMARARRVADLALHGGTSVLAGQATHYHTIWIVPLWAHEMSKVAIIGHHVFYRPPLAYGGWPVLAPVAAALSAPVGGLAGVRNGEVVAMPPAVSGAAHGSEGAGARAEGQAPGGGNPPAPMASAVAGGDRRGSYFPSARRHEGALALPSVP